MRTASRYTRGAVTILVVLAGCAPAAVPSTRTGDVATAEASVRDVAPSDPGGSAASAPPSLASFGDQYLALVEPLNDAACEFDTLAYSPGAGRVVLRSVTSDFADAIRAFVGAARNAEWPDSIRDPIDELTRGMEMQEEALQTALDSTDDESFFESINAAQRARAATGPVALLVRTTLGLDGLRQTCTDP